MGNNRNKKGFTLSEVLITLAIIGIVAALTIPTIMTNIQDAQLKAAWRKAFATASQAYQQAVDENNGNGFGAYTCNAASNPKVSAIASHLNVIKTCNGNAGGSCWEANGVPYPNGSFPPGGGCDCFMQNWQTTLDYAFVTADGMRWLAYGNPYTVGWTCSIFLVDVNGAGGPNLLGVDVLGFVMNDKTITPGAACITMPNAQNYLLQ